MPCYLSLWILCIFLTDKTFCRTTYNTLLTNIFQTFSEYILCIVFTLYQNLYVIVMCFVLAQQNTTFLLFSWSFRLSSLEDMPTVSFCSLPSCRSVLADFVKLAMQFNNWYSTVKHTHLWQCILNCVPQFHISHCSCNSFSANVRMAIIIELQLEHVSGDTKTHLGWNELVHEI